MNVWSMLLWGDPPPSPDTFRIGPWEDLASIKWLSEELGLTGPDGSFCLQSPLLLSKARRGRKFEHEDSAQIAVTLASEVNQGQEREKELGCPPPVVQILSSFHLRKTQHRHTDMCNQHMLLTTQLWPSALYAEQRSRWTHLQPNTQRHTDTHAYFEPPRKHNSCCKHKQFTQFTIQILWCFSSSLFLCPSIHKHDWRTLIKICYNEPPPLDLASDLWESDLLCHISYHISAVTHKLWQYDNGWCIYPDLQWQWLWLFSHLIHICLSACGRKKRMCMTTACHWHNAKRNTFKRGDI